MNLFRLLLIVFFGIPMAVVLGHWINDAVHTKHATHTSAVRAH